MSYGFKMANTANLRFEVLGGLDTDRYANATYSAMLNRPALQQDVRELRDPKVLRGALKIWGYDPTKRLVLIGCAPCQGFSSHRKKDSRKDDRNELLAAFGDIASMLKPDAILMENVPEMLHRNHWSHFAMFKKRIARSGYMTRARLYNLASFGVPQERYRALVLAARDHRYLEMPLPTHQPSEFVTVRDAIGHLPPLVAGQSSPSDPMHLTSRHRPETVHLLSLIPHDGGSRCSLPQGVGPDCHKRVDGFRDVYGRLWWDKPAVAITARCRTPSCGRYTHPIQDRGLSVREAALLQGFPQEFQFQGPFDDKYKQIGNAVAPIFSRALALHLDLALVGRAAPSSVEDDVIAPIGKSISSALAGMKRQLRLAETLEVAA
jgi:DNA (cytosine-5)-methyltransferase 1